MTYIQLIWNNINCNSPITTNHSFERFYIVIFLGSGSLIFPFLITERNSDILKWLIHFGRYCYHLNNSLHTAAVFHEKSVQFSPLSVDKTYNFSNFLLGAVWQCSTYFILTFKHNWKLIWRNNTSYKPDAVRLVYSQVLLSYHDERERNISVSLFLVELTYVILMHS